MWKLLRNLLLSIGVLALGVKLALWFAAAQQAQWLGDSVKRWGELTWTGASGRFDGSVVLSGAQFRPVASVEAAAFSAATLELQTPGLIWLLGRAITRDTSLPDQLGLRLRSVNAPALRKLAGANDPPWFGTQSLVPFETFACGASTQFDAADFASMQVQPRSPQLNLEYRFDAAAQNVEFDLRIDNAPFATLRLRSELRHVSPRLFDEPATHDAVRIGSADFSYDDGGFLRRRNQFCARETGLDVDGFIERHIAAVQERLKASHIVPAEGVVEMYRRLLAEGGDVQLLSLPRDDIAPTQYDTYDPEEVLRWLNLTARHNDEPPVLFKLFFLAEPVEALAGIDLALMQDPSAEPDTVVVRPEENPVLATTTGTAAPKAPSAVTPPVSAATTTIGSPESAGDDAAVAVLPTATTPKTSDSTPPTLGPAASATASTPAAAPAAPRPPRIDPRLDPRLAGLPSAPPPPPGSTAALVWQGPRIDRLPDKPAVRERPFAVVSYDALGGQAGARVVLITSGGKEIEGKVAEVSAAGVTISVNRESGQARLFVERTRILEIRIARRG